MNKTYSDYIEISPKFESVVDIDADIRNENLWREYIVGDDMEKLMEVLCQSLNNEAPDARRSFWIEGTYGTGKSYAAIVIKHLIEEKPEVVDEFLQSNGRLSKYRNRFMKCRNKGDHLVIWKTGCTGIKDGNAMLMEAEKAVREALDKKFGSNADYGESSLADAVKNQIHNPEHNWDYILENSVLGDDYGSVEELQDAIDAGNLTALQRTADEIRRRGWGLVDSLETFKKWISTVIENNHLDKSGIFFIWDEFTEYVANSDDQTLLQQLSEFSKVKPFFMLFVVHRTSDMVERITPERYQLITHRFHSVEFHISADAAFDLIAGSINIRNGMNEHWDEEKKSVVKNIKPFLPDMSGLDDKISEQISLLCPVHPMTIKLLSRVAENYAASQRTMFRFMKDQSSVNQGFVGYINKYGPDDQANWLTPEWLWDYFFTRESDFSDKETKVAEYIRHYEESKHLVESDENALRVFKTAMLLMAIMSSVKGLFIGKKTKDGITATEDCLATCLAGVIKRESIHDFLETMHDSKILVLDKDSHDNVRIQLPFKGGVGDSFDAKFQSNDRKYTRYTMFSKDGVFAQTFEKRANDENDAISKRMKIAVCCAETNSINARMAEITKELEKFPYKLGLLLVTVQSDAQYSSLISTIKNRAAECGEPRLIIAMVKEPLTDDKRKKWLTAITKQELANDSGQTGAANQHKMEATTIVETWVSSASEGSKIVAFNCDQEITNIFGVAHLRKEIRKRVFDKIFKFAPENIVVTNTAYKTCNDAAATAGVSRKSNNSQMKNVLAALEQAGVLNAESISEVSEMAGGKAAESIAALAKIVKNEMESGQRVVMSELWEKLQREPFGYYDTIACGVLLGYVVSFYTNSKYTWTDSVQSPHILAEATLSNMVMKICKGKMTTDFLSAGSITWQNFSEYLGKIFNLTTAQLAEQTTGFHNTREAVTKSGAPFWALKYLPSTVWFNEDIKVTAPKVIDSIQSFITQDGDAEEAMNTVLNLMKGRGKLRKILSDSFQDKSVLSSAFRSFLFESSPELKDIATKLSVQSEELSDKLHSVMQGAIYTWTEEQVKEKLVEVTQEYIYLDAISQVFTATYHSIEAAQKDIGNLFKHLRIPMVAIEQLKLEWYPALSILQNIATGGAFHLTTEQRVEEIAVLEKYGVFAKDCLSDGKPVLNSILSKKNIECTDEELKTIYEGLKYIGCDSSLNQFESEIEKQISKIKSKKNKTELQELWKYLSGMDTVKDWCSHYGVPIMWIVPSDLSKTFETIIDVQKGDSTIDKYVVAAITALKNMDRTIISDSKKIESLFLDAVGREYEEIWIDQKATLVNKAKLQCGNDMSSWSAADLAKMCRILKNAQQEKAKKEKLEGAKATVKSMNDSLLRDKVSAFLDNHPEFCEEFTK